MSSYGRRNGAADETTRVSYHKAHLLSGDVFGRDDEITLVFARDGVKDYNELALLCDGLLITSNFGNLPKARL